MSKIVKKRELEKTDIKYKPTNLFIIFLTICISLIGYFIAGFVIVLFSYNSFDVKDFVLNHDGAQWFSFLLGFVAFWLYNFKSRQQFWYGIIEVSFGYFSITKVAVRLKETIAIVGIDPFTIIAGISAAYLIIRGLSNVSEGYSKPFKWKSIVVKYSAPS